MLYQLSYSRKRTLHRYHFRGLGGRVVCGRRSKQGQEMGRDARRVVSVSDEGSRIDIGSRAITLIDGTIEAEALHQGVERENV
jgi:hypothetical protein